MALPDDSSAETPLEAPAASGPAAPAPGSPPDRLTRRERRRRILLLLLLLLLLAALSWVVYSVVKNRSLPSIATIAREDKVLPPEFVFAMTGSGANALGRPTGVAVAPNNDVYVVDFGKRRIAVFSRTGDFKFAFDKIADGKLRNPVNVAITGNEVWVTDRRLRTVLVFDLQGNYLRTFQPAAMAAWTPLAIALGSGGEVRVTDVGDTARHQLIYLKKDGTVEKTLGQTRQVNDPMSSPATFYFPSGVAIAKDGRVFVSDGDNRRVQVFDKTGTFLYIINTSGVPRGIAVDDKERLYVVDALAHTVGVYSLKGEPIVEFGEQGFGPGQFNFPDHISVGPDKRLYVTDRDNNQVQVWEWPAAVVPSPVAEAVRSPYWLLLPLLLLPLLLLWLLRRKRRYVVTPDFVDALIDAGAVDLLRARRLLFLAPIFDAERYQGRVVPTRDGSVDLGEVIEVRDFSPTDVDVLKGRYGIDERSAAYVAMAERARALLTDDQALTNVALRADLRVLDSRMFIAERREGDT